MVGSYHVRRTPEGLTLAMLFKRRIDGDCWRFTGRRNSEGYGDIQIGPNKWDRVHRVAYQLWVGPIPAGLVIDHLCRVRDCFNPAHLEPVTIGDNVRRGLAARRGEFNPLAK